MKFRFFIFLISFFFFLAGFSQQKYWVVFTDKNGTEFNPYEYFDEKAIERRIKHNFPLNHYSDWPVNDTYVSQVGQLVEAASKTTRWFNAVAVYAFENQIAEVEKLPFVKDVQEIVTKSVLTAVGKEIDTTLTASKRDLMKRQLERLGGPDFAKNNINGKGVRIAIFDAGFPAVDVHPAFDHIRKDGRILKTYDFVANKENAYRGSSHGTMVLSCIAGKAGDENVGMATEAEFLLARTEMGLREPFSEEENWMAAVEWADKNGADLVNSSLAYTYNRYFRWDMNGKTAFVTKAAKLAARKGILIMNAAGNDGDNDWKIIATPSDVDSVLTVGGISPSKDYHISFSSFGPTADKRMKPNVCAFGKALVAGKTGYSEAFGTSFATPLVTGFVACVLQAKPELTAMQLWEEIQKSGDLYPYFDYAHGHGVPSASYFLEGKKDAEPTFDFNKEKFSLKVVVKDEFFDEEISFDDLKDAIMDAMPSKDDYLFYHIENARGYLDYYYVVKVEQKEVLDLPLENYEKGKKIRVHYMGYTDEFEF
ncbi:MAG: hypothetical protein COA57_03190 [Flavobacteriales bacterium]|nr:MAG: hypothetical protein COA57_03190 [Flavobacteriales bacterium]